LHHLIAQFGSFCEILKVMKVTCFGVRCLLGNHGTRRNSVFFV